MIVVLKLRALSMYKNYSYPVIVGVHEVNLVFSFKLLNLLSSILPIIVCLYLPFLLAIVLS